MTELPHSYIKILGCGHSYGVPCLRGVWGECDPEEPRNRRTRSSIFIQTPGTKLLVDTGPDLRHQFLREEIHDLDAVFYTHDHADHAHGLNELVALSRHKKKPIPAYGSPETLASLKRSFPYAFESSNAHYAPFLTAHPLLPGEPVTIGGVCITPFSQDHGWARTLGFLVEGRSLKKVAYSTDVISFPACSEPYLRGLDVWIVDCLKRTPHPTHSHLEQTMGWVSAFAPRQAVLTHMDASLDYQTLCASLPHSVRPAYDGMVIPLGLEATP